MALDSALLPEPAHVAGAAMIAAGAAGGALVGRRLGRMAPVAVLPALWLIGSGLSQFPLFDIQHSWSATMWLVVVLVPVGYSLGAIAGAVLIKQARFPGRIRTGALPASGHRIHVVLVICCVIGLVEVGYQSVGAGGVPLFSHNIDATRFAQPRGPTSVLTDLLIVVAILAFTIPRDPLGRAHRFELAIGLVAFAGLALQGGRISLFIPAATTVVARALIWGPPRWERVAAATLAAVLLASGVFYARVGQHRNQPFEHELYNSVLPRLHTWERPFLPEYIAISMNFAALDGLVNYFPATEGFGHGVFDSVAFDRVLPARGTGQISERTSPPITTPTFAGALWADGGIPVVWLGAAILGGLMGAGLMLADRTRSYPMILLAAYLTVLAAMEVYTNLFTQYPDWLIIAPALIVTGAIASQPERGGAGLKPRPIRAAVGSEPSGP
jgi:hypothetical protein